MWPKSGSVGFRAASATGEPRCGVPIVTSVLTRSATPSTPDIACRALEPTQAVCDHMQLLSLSQRHVEDRGRELITAIRDATDRIHLRGEDDMALPAKVKGDAVKVIDERRQPRQSAEPENAMRENNRVPCHCEIRNPRDRGPCFPRLSLL